MIFDTAVFTSSYLFCEYSDDSDVTVAHAVRAPQTYSSS